MICKITQGDKAKGLMQYLLRSAASPTVFDLNPKTAEEYAKVFDSHNANYSWVKRPLYHMCFRFPKETKPTEQEFEQLTKNMLEDMGLCLNRPYLIVAHKGENEESGRHIHVVCSRIDYSGKVWSGGTSKWGCSDDL